MQKKNETNAKQKYRLWWEYLKRSPNYKEFCEWIEKKKLNPTLPIPKKANWFQLWNGYLFFGNLHVDSFEEWWNRNEEYIKSKGEGGFPKPVEDYTDFAMDQMEDVIRGFKLKNDREPTLEEFKTAFWENLKSPIPRFYLMVTLLDGNRFEELGKQFTKILKEKKKEQARIVKQKNEEYMKWFVNKLPFPVAKADPEKFLTWPGRWKYPTYPIWLPEIQQYLKIYDMRYPRFGKKVLTVKEIAEKKYLKIGENGKKYFKVKNPERIINEIIEKAKKIIKNAERGIFPGNY